MAMLSTMFYYVCADALPVFVQERHIYLHETTHNAYRLISYVLPVLRAVGGAGGGDGEPVRGAGALQLDAPPRLLAGAHREANLILLPCHKSSDGSQSTLNNAICAIN
jgi:hypothetical protein